MTEHSVIALDPGVRTFQTGYCPDGHIKEFGTNEKHTKRIQKHLFIKDKLKSLITLEKNSRKNKI